MRELRSFGCLILTVILAVILALALWRGYTTINTPTSSPDDVLFAFTSAQLAGDLSVTKRNGLVTLMIITDDGKSTQTYPNLITHDIIFADGKPETIWLMMNTQDREAILKTMHHDSVKLYLLPQVAYTPSPIPINTPTTFPDGVLFAFTSDQLAGDLSLTKRNSWVTLMIITDNGKSTQTYPNLITHDIIFADGKPETIWLMMNTQDREAILKTMHQDGVKLYLLPQEVAYTPSPKPTATPTVTFTITFDLPIDRIQFERALLIPDSAVTLFIVAEKRSAEGNVLTHETKSFPATYVADYKVRLSSTAEILDEFAAHLAGAQAIYLHSESTPTSTPTHTPPP